MLKSTPVHKVLLIIITLYFIFYGVYIDTPIGGGFSPPSFSSLLILNGTSGDLFVVKNIGLNTKILGHAPALYTHNLIEIETIGNENRIYASSLFYLIKEAPQNGIGISEVYKIFNDKIQKRVKEVFLCYLNYLIPQAPNFPPNDWYWIVITEDNSKYLVNYRTGEIYEK